MLAQLPLLVIGPVDLLGGHGQPARDPGRVLATSQPAKHPRGLAIGGLLVAGQDLLGLLAVGGGPFELAGAVAGGLVELAAQPVPLGPQLRRGQPLQVRAVRGVDGQGLATRPRHCLGQLQVAIRLVAVGQIQLARALGLRADDRVQPGVLAGSGQLHIQPVDILGAGEPDQGPPPGQPLARWPVVA